MAATTRPDLVPARGVGAHHCRRHRGHGHSKIVTQNRPALSSGTNGESERRPCDRNLQARLTYADPFHQSARRWKRFSAHPGRPCSRHRSSVPRSSVHSPAPFAIATPASAPTAGSSSATTPSGCSTPMAARPRCRATEHAARPHWLIDRPRVDQVTIHTGAGPKHLRLLRRDGRRFWFEMNMGSPVFDEREIRCHHPLKSGAQEVTILDVGNPQCVVFVESFPENWEALGAEIEAHPRFPKRTNVSFVRVIDRPYHRDAFLRARRGSDAEFRHRIHRRRRGRDSTESGCQSGYDPDAGRRILATALG